MPSTQDFENPGQDHNMMTVCSKCSQPCRTWYYPGVKNQKGEPILLKPVLGTLVAEGVMLSSCCDAKGKLVRVAMKEATQNLFVM